MYLKFTYLVPLIGCFLNVLFLSNTDINILSTHVFAQMFPPTHFLSFDFACGICKDQLGGQVINRFLYGFWALVLML